jgi:hypothetical protein
MSRIGCLRASLLLQKRASGLDESEQLRLEEHLSQCESCHEESLALASFRDLALRAESPLDGRIRERVIRRAVDAGEERRPDLVRRPLPLLAAAASVALAAAVTGIFISLPEDGAHPERPRAALERESGRERVLRGEIATCGRVIPAGGDVKSGVVLESRRGAKLDLGIAVVELGADTHIKWSKGKSSVDLLAGKLQAEVETGNRFRVITDRFLVVVAGTRFEVSRYGVKVYEGQVRVVSSEGEALLAELGPEQIWEYEPAALAGAESEKPASTSDESRQPPPFTRASLAQARKRLSRGKVGEARRMVRAALAGKLSPKQRAEAETLLAECSLVAGDRATAARRYLAVASRYPHLAAAENALFAAARLRAESGERSAALALFKRYIRKYPNGRFRPEVGKRLRELERE